MNTSIRIFHVDAPKIPFIESVDLSGRDGYGVSDNGILGIYDLSFREFSFRDNSYVKVIRKLSNKYHELIELAEQRIVYLNESLKKEKLPSMEHKCLTLLWRVRPYLEGIKNNHGTLIGYGARFRVAVIPDLTEEQWEDFLRIPLHEIPLDCQPKKEDDERNSIQ